MAKRTILFKFFTFHNMHAPSYSSTISIRCELFVGLGTLALQGLSLPRNQ